MVPALGRGERTRVTEISAGEALLAVAPSTVAQFPGDRGSLGAMAALARAVPAYRLELAGGPAEGAAALDGLLSELRGMSEPLLSIVMPVWNGAEFIAEAITSLLDQDDAGPLEVVVADDGSTDASAEVAAAAGARVVSRPHAGVAAARNVGIAAARGELIGFLDSDDVSLPGTLRARRDVLAAEPGLDFVVGRLEVFGPGAGGLPPWIAERAVGGSPAGGLWAFVARRSLFERVGPFDESFELAEDADWLGRVAAAGAHGESVDRSARRCACTPTA